LTSKTILNAIGQALKTLAVSTPDATIKAYNSTYASIITECTALYKSFTDSKVIIREYDLLHLGALPFKDFVLQVNALSAHMTRTYMGAYLLCFAFAQKFDRVSSTRLQALYKELSGVSIGLLPKFSQTPMHFGLHGSCKYQTGEVHPNKFYDTVCFNIFGCYPLAMKSSKIMTRIESGFYHPIDSNAKIYHQVASSLDAQKIAYLCERFATRCHNEVEKKTLKI